MDAARACNAGMSFLCIRLRIVTIGLDIVISFIRASMSPINFPAIGDHDPFSTSPTWRPLKFFDAR